MTALRVKNLKEILNDFSEEALIVIEHSSIASGIDLSIFPRLIHIVPECGGDLAGNYREAGEGMEAIVFSVGEIWNGED